MAKKADIIWKTIPGFSNYEISENGDVRRRLAAAVGTSQSHISRIIRGESWGKEQ